MIEQESKMLHAAQMTEVDVLDPHRHTGENFQMGTDWAEEMKQKIVWKQATEIRCPTDSEP